jgi:hypothetical protein
MSIIIGETDITIIMAIITELAITVRVVVGSLAIILAEFGLQVTAFINSCVISQC